MICPKCNIDKEANEVNFAFRRDAQCLRKTCRECTKAKRKERRYSDKYGTGIDAYHRYLRRERLRARRSRKKKPEINRKANAKWRAKNLERCRELARAYRVRRGAEYMKQWRARNREWFNSYMRDYRRLNSLKATEPSKLIELIVAALPRGLPVEIRDEVTQEMLVRVLGKEIRMSQVKSQVKPLVAKFYRDYANRALVSLDAPVRNFKDLTLGETIAG